MTGKFDEKKIINPIHTVTNGVEKPIYEIKDQINSNNRFVITKDTDDGKYVRGNLIFYSINGVEIYAEINDAIYVDLINKTATVRKFSEIEDDNTIIDPEEKQYAILFVPTGYDEEDNDIDCRWSAVQGRTNAYELIKYTVENYEIDVTRSLVLTDNVKFKDSLSLVQFVDYIKNSNFVKDDDFDIQYYAEEEWEGL